MKKYSVSYWGGLVATRKPIQVVSMVLAKASLDGLVKKIVLEDKCVRYIPLEKEEKIINYLEKALTNK